MDQCTHEVRAEYWRTPQFLLQPKNRSWILLKYRVLPVRKHTRIQSPMNQPRFGCQTEKLDDIAGQLSFFNEVEAKYNGIAPEPARWIAEKHVIKVYVGTDGAHQDEFLRGDHPETLFKGSSIATPSQPGSNPVIYCV